MRSFITGSRAYGNPNESSDIDLVVLVTKADLKRLAGQAEKTIYGGPDSDGGWVNSSFRFGNMNLICVSSIEAFQCWKDGTNQLKKWRDKHGPVSREQAIQVFRQLRHERGLGPSPKKMKPPVKPSKPEPVAEQAGYASGEPFDEDIPF